jgi:glycerate-2-kinase
MALQSPEGRALLPKGIAIAAGLIAGPRPYNSELPPLLEWFDASHPSPNSLSEAAGRRALAL